MRSCRSITAPTLLLFFGVCLPAALTAQDPPGERFPGVSLGLLYEGVRDAPTIGIQPFAGAPAMSSIAERAENILARDLRYSNRFRVLDNLPAALVRDQVDYALWDQINATWLVSGRVEAGSGGRSTLVLEVHDVVYREVVQRGNFPLPDPQDPEFRLAVHMASDAVVQWVFQEPGIAATRIVFARRMDDGSQDLWVVDSDGENLRRMTRERPTEEGYAITLSPAWSPDGTRVAYTSYRTGMPRIYELDVRTGTERVVPTPRAGDYITPAYHPEGELLYFAVNGGQRSGLYSYNIVRECCFSNVTEGRWEDFSPTFSPDGRQIAFNSNRLGVGTPQVYLMPAGGGQPSLISPYLYSRPGYYTSPEWSPRGNRIAYHGRIEQRGAHQILVSEVGNRSRIVQLPSEGVNEDPSWAPDGRHLVYTGTRSWGRGLFIVDTETGATRTLVSGLDVRYPAWSPSLGTSLSQERD